MAAFDQPEIKVSKNNERLSFDLALVQELKKLVHRGEGSHLEFKRKVAHPDKIIKELIAFANTGGGIMLIGVADDKSIPGLKYPEAMKQMIFQPLGMTNTFVFDITKDRDMIAPSYRGTMEIAIDYLDGIYGDKNIYSTPRDLLKFDKARYAPFFLNPDLISKIYKGYSYESKGIRNYGLGIRMTEFEKGEPFYYHNGWWHGNTSCFINLRKEKVTIIVLSNKFTKKTYQTKRLAALFGDYPFKLNDDGEE